MKSNGASSFTPRFLTVLALAAAGLQAQSNFVYTNNDLYPANSVSAFLVGSTGALTELAGSPFLTGGQGAGGGAYAANRIVAGPGNFLFVANDVSQNISVFSIDPVGGGLTPVAGSPFATGSTAAFNDISLAVSPDGKYLFAGLGGTSTIATFSIAANGALSPPVSTVPAGAVPNGLKVTADGKYLAVGLPGLNGGSVGMFTIASGGALSPVAGSPFAEFGLGSAASVDINCAVTNLYDGENSATSSVVDSFAVSSSGALTSPKPNYLSTGQNSSFLALSPDDKLLFISNQNSGTLTVAAVAADGSLTLAPGSPAAFGGGTPAGAATGQGGHWLFVAGYPNSVSVFAVAADGSLTAAPGSPFTTSQPAGLLSLAAFPAKVCAAAAPPPPPSAIIVAIDVVSGGKKNQINLKSPTRIDVAILSSPSFNAVAQVDPGSLTFGHTGDEHSLSSCDTVGSDVNRDGLPDLVCHFNKPQSGLQSGDTTAVLKGSTWSHTAIQGTASVQVTH